MEISMREGHSTVTYGTRISMLLLAAVAALLVLSTSAYASFGLVPGTFEGDAYQQDGTPMTQAAGHPFRATTSFQLNLTDDGAGNQQPDGNMKDLQVDLPVGFVGDPQAAPVCTSQQLTTAAPGLQTSCPIDSQVGQTNVSLFNNGLRYRVVAPVYNMVPQRGEVAAFGFRVLSVTVRIIASVRTDTDYGITATLHDANSTVAIVGSDFTLWGTPADAANDAQRSFYSNEVNFGGSWFDAGHGGGDLPAGVALRPFVTLPSDCAHGPFTTKIRVSSYADPNVWHSDEATTASPATGCDALQFAPDLTVTPDTWAPDSPTGLGVALDLPQDTLAGELGTPPLRTAKVTLPEGTTINPASADGLAACTDQQLQLQSTAPVSCPEASKLGTVEAESPVLGKFNADGVRMTENGAPVLDTLTGGIYLRSQASNDPASGNMFRIALVLENQERGLSVRLPGSIQADPTTGRLVTTFDNNPQLPVSRIQLQFKGGPRAPLATPPTCGEKTVDAHLTSWAGQSTDAQSKFTINCTAGLGGFSPSFAAGTSQPIGGAFSPFNLSIAKPDGNAPLTGLSMVLPPGLVAQLKGNVGTQVGSVRAFAGPGSNPFVLPGQVFLDGPYGDAPFSLRVVVPAKAGPFDLGTVTVRQKIYVDPIDAHVTVVSDPLPTIVSGVPVRLQRLDVSVDKPGFMINPTSCDATAISGTLSSAANQSVPVTNRFQVGDCASLALKPDLAINLTGKGQTTDGKHPGVVATLKQPFGGQSNLRHVKVTLPLSLALDPDNAQALCEFADGSKVAPTCPAGSIVGHASAVTPILDQPLSGPVYFVKNQRTDAKTKRQIKTLPKLVIPLKGNGVALTLTATSEVPDNEHLVTTFDAIPDAPVSDFVLSIDGGTHGILAVSGEKIDICKATQTGLQEIIGQNGKTMDAKVILGTPCALAVVASAHTSTRLKVTVGGIGAGKVSVSGKGVIKTTRTISSATTATLQPKLTKATRSALAHRHNVKVKVTVSYTPKGTKKTKTAHNTLTIHAAKKATKKQ